MFTMKSELKSHDECSRRVQHHGVNIAHIMKNHKPLQASSVLELQHPLLQISLYGSAILIVLQP